MTALNGPILFNSSSGSDTQASGCGPSSAVFGTTGTCSSGSNVVTGINTTGVNPGDLFWGDTSSGRQFSVIATVDSGTQVTLDDNLAANHSGNLTWAIGGKTGVSIIGWKRGAVFSAVVCEGQTEDKFKLDNSRATFLSVYLEGDARRFRKGMGARARVFARDQGFAPRHVAGWRPRGERTNE